MPKIISKISFILIILFSVSYAIPGQAATFTVNSTADAVDALLNGTCATADSVCTLRAAIQEANALGGINTISLPAGNYILSLTGIFENSAAIGDLDITAGTLTITGAGANQTTITASGDRIFDITAGATGVTLSAMKITGGSIGLNGDGGGIQNASTLTGSDLFITNNSASSGGGIYSTGTATISNSLISSNQAMNTSTGRGGAIQNSGGTLTVTNSTIANNTAVDRAGGIDGVNTSTTKISFSTILYNDADSDNDSGTTWGGGLSRNSSGSTFTIKNSIVAFNTENNGATINSNCLPTLAPTTSYNIESGTSCTFTGTGDQQNVSAENLLLASLTDNGGGTQTYRLQAGSTALNAGTCTDANSVVVTTDQRGLTRPGSNCSIGAYEKDSTAPIISVTGSSATVECTATYTDAGATATDNFYPTAPTVSSDASSLSTVTTGNKTVTYSASDNDGNAATAVTRTVTVVDTTAPVITVTGTNPVTVDFGSTYTDVGATATDTCTGSRTVTTTNPVNTSVAGTYTVTYSASDGTNTATATRTVTVSAAPTTSTNSNTNTNTDTTTNDTATDSLDTIEISNDAIDNDGDGAIDEVNTLEENGIHPQYGSTDVTDKDAYNLAVTKIKGFKNGKIKVTFADSSIYKYSVFSGDTDTKTIVKQQKKSGWLLVLNAKATKLALVNPYTGVMQYTLALSNTTYSDRSLKQYQLRPDQDSAFETILTLKKNDKVKLFIIKVNLKKQKLSIYGKTSLTNNSVDVSNTKITDQAVQLNDATDVKLQKYNVTSDYQFN